MLYFRNNNFNTDFNNDLEILILISNFTTDSLCDVISGIIRNFTHLSNPNPI